MRTDYDAMTLCSYSRDAPTMCGLNSLKGMQIDEQTLLAAGVLSPQHSYWTYEGLTSFECGRHQSRPSSEGQEDTVSVSFSCS